MSVGKTEKAKHVTAATNYRDIDGNMRTFTHIDYDVKQNMSTWKPSEEEINNIKDQRKQYRIEVIQRILDTPASTAPDVFYDFTVRGEGMKKIEWNETMLRDEGLTTDRLVSMAVLMERINNI